MDPTDILALVLMAIFSVRRSEARTTEGRAVPAVPAEQFDAGRGLVLRSRGLVAHASLAKVALNSAWFFLFRDRVEPNTLRTVGILLFFSWSAALVVAAWYGLRAGRIASRFSIVEGRRLVPAEGPARDDV
jgi:hypothetical protein